ncbi:alcohol dehydrogenase transcription factor myb/SANT-like domain-containing protein [Ditylenchus destructor]|nr:alcohol dehydrogenase transcription factor myb/SANT-like domain-containing protein [Ditylenchus destructor]
MPNSEFSSQETSPEGNSKQSIHALIESVRNRPMLWDKADNDYKKAIKKSEIWEVIAKESGFKDGSTATAKWNYLRGEYGRLKKKLPSGSDSNEVKRRKQSEDSLDQAILELVQRQQNETEEELFGRTVALKLSRLEPKNRELAQMDIEKVLFNYQFMTDGQ